MKFPLLKVTTDASLVLSLRQQLSTVTVSLQTMTAGKTKMEASYQKDKKNMLVRGGRRERGEGGGSELGRGLRVGRKRQRYMYRGMLGRREGDKYCICICIIIALYMYVHA